jgi:hypothetical protein
MKLRQLVSLLAILLFINLLSPSIFASWVGFTPQQLVENSEVILIGEIRGPVDEKMGIRNSGLTLWKVNVRYYLKGNYGSKEFIVATPGAKSSFAKSSIDYRLDEWGKTVLLFLRKSDNFYQPLTPKGVIVLNDNQYTRQPDELLNGRVILKEFSINDKRILKQEQSEFEQFILDRNSVVVPSTLVQVSEGNLTKNYSRQIVVVTLVFIVTFFILFRKRFDK